jgi:hypothetical protein
MPTLRAKPRPLLRDNGFYDRSAIMSASWAMARAALVPARSIRATCLRRLRRFARPSGKLCNEYGVGQKASVHVSSTALPPSPKRPAGPPCQLSSAKS